MPIDITTEQPITLSDATALMPRRRRGRKPAASTLYRWAVVGVRGVVLETIQVGGTKCTSIQALQRFFDRLTALEANATTLSASDNASRQRAEEASQALDKLWGRRG